MTDKEIIEELEIGIRYYFPTLEGNRCIDKLKEQLTLAEKRGEEKARKEIRENMSYAECVDDNGTKGWYYHISRVELQALKQSQEREK